MQEEVTGELSIPWPWRRYLALLLLYYGLNTSWNRTENTLGPLFLQNNQVPMALRPLVSGAACPRGLPSSDCPSTSPWRDYDAPPNRMSRKLFFSVFLSFSACTTGVTCAPTLCNHVLGKHLPLFCWPPTLSDICSLFRKLQWHAHTASDCVGLDGRGLYHLGKRTMCGIVVL